MLSFYNHGSKILILNVDTVHLHILCINSEKLNYIKNSNKLEHDTNYCTQVPQNSKELLINDSRLMRRQRVYNRSGSRFIASWLIGSSSVGLSESALDNQRRPGSLDDATSIAKLF